MVYVQIKVLCVLAFDVNVKVKVVCAQAFHAHVQENVVYAQAFYVNVWAFNDDVWPIHDIFRRGRLIEDCLSAALF